MTVYITASIVVIKSIEAGPFSGQNVLSTWPVLTLVGLAVLLGESISCQGDIIVTILGHSMLLCTM